jgi:hypothetical protein
MKPLRHRIGILAFTLTLAVAALLLPSYPAHAWQGHGAAHAGQGGAGHNGHHGRHSFSGGFIGSWGGVYPYWDYDPFYAGTYGYGVVPGNAYGGTFGYGTVPGNFPYVGINNPYWGVPSAVPYTNYSFMNSIDFFR